MKKLILSVLCGIWAAAAFAQSASKQELAQWAQNNAWLPYKALSKKGGKQPTRREVASFRFEDWTNSYFDGCNTCYERLRFEASAQQISLGEVTCTEKHCLDKEPKSEPSPRAGLGLWERIATNSMLRVLSCDSWDKRTLRYSREGNDLILENECGKVWLRIQS